MGRAPVKPCAGAAKLHLSSAAGHKFLQVAKEREAAFKSQIESLPLCLLLNPCPRPESLAKKIFTEGNEENKGRIFEASKRKLRRFTAF
jgi:hypothetical protein